MLDDEQSNHLKSMLNSLYAEQREVSCLINHLTEAIDGRSKKVSTSIPLIILCGDSMEPKPTSSADLLMSSY